MKVKKNFVLRSVAGQYIVVPVGYASMDFNAVITLNDTGAFLWNSLIEDTDIESITNSLLAEYDIDRDTAAADIAKFIEKLRNANLLDE